MNELRMKTNKQVTKEQDKKDIKKWVSNQPTKQRNNLPIIQPTNTQNKTKQ